MGATSKTETNIYIYAASEMLEKIQKKDEFLSVTKFESPTIRKCKYIKLKKKYYNNVEYFFICYFF